MKEAEVTSLRTAQCSDENANSSLLSDRNTSGAANRRVAELENHVTRLEEERTNHKLRISQLETRVSDLDGEVRHVTQATFSACKMAPVS